MAAGYDPELPGLDEARLDGYRELIISKIGLLNTALQRDRALRAVLGVRYWVLGRSYTTRLPVDAISLSTKRVKGDLDGMDFRARLDMGLTSVPCLPLSEFLVQPSAAIPPSSPLRGLSRSTVPGAPGMQWRELPEL